MKYVKSDQYDTIEEGAGALYKTFLDSHQTCPQYLLKESVPKFYAAGVGVVGVVGVVVVTKYVEI